MATPLTFPPLVFSVDKDVQISRCLTVYAFEQGNVVSIDNETCMSGGSHEKNNGPTVR